ncbi:MAG: hypothetical protein DRJ57_02500, partial [Thermoprotei archaeon]
MTDEAARREAGEPHALDEHTSGGAQEGDEDLHPGLLRHSDSQRDARNTAFPKDGREMEPYADLLAKYGVQFL